MQDLVVSVQPTFYCENHCPYCYLGNEIRNNETLDLKTLEGRLFELSEIAKISQIDLFGGELDFLPISYLLELVKLCKKFSKEITISTGARTGLCLSVARDEKVKLGISLNDERPYNKETEEFILKYKDYYKNITILMVVLPSLIKKSPVEICDYLQKFNLPVTFFRYISSVSNNPYNISSNKYIKFIKELYSWYIQHNQSPYAENLYTFPIVYPTKESLGSPLISSNIFILPNGDYSWVAYRGGLEYFKASSDLSIWKKDSISEYKRYYKLCNKCPYFNNCLAEHLDLDTIENKGCLLPDLIQYLSGI